MKNFRTYNLAVQFYQSCQQLTLPRHLRDQLDRAASSIALNLAEGYGRSTRKEQKRFFDIAFGSMRESQAVLDLAAINTPDLLALSDSLAANIFCLLRAMKREL